MPRRIHRASKVISKLTRPLFSRPVRRSTRSASSKGIVASRVARPLGQKFLFKTRYFDTIEIDPTTGGIPSNYIFRLSSLYDPDLSSAGHQPMGFDQIMPLYKHYTVQSVKVTMYWSNHDPNYSQLVCAQVKNNSIASYNIPEIIENSNSKWIIVSPKGSGTVIRKMSLTINLAKYFGKSLNDQEFMGTETSSPSEQVYLHLLSGPLDSVDAVAMHCSILLEYTAILTEPLQLGQS